MEFPDDIAALCFARRSRLAARAITRAYNARLKPLDLQITQLTLLIAIDRSLISSIAHMADFLDIEPSGVLRNLRVLERRGLAVSDGARGRGGSRYRLTDAGRGLIDRAAPIWTEAQQQMERALGGRSAAARDVLAGLEAAALTLEGASHEHQ